MTLREDMADVAGKVEAYLDNALPEENKFPENLHKAMRYSVFSGGKRVRPYLAYKVHALFSADKDEIIPFCAALEMIHTYSLIHDDLPCMDDDDMRRGRPSCHIVFGEAEALLAGDALLTEAFHTIAGCSSYSQKVIIRAVESLAGAAGYSGMVGGQFADIQSEGSEPDQPIVEYIHMNKTGELIRVACEIGAVAGGAEEKHIQQINEYGKRLGMAFQIVDDILDETGAASKIGKSTGKDKKAGKMTYPAVFGLEESGKLALVYTQKAVSSLQGLPGKTQRLVEFAEYLAKRME